jgi:hypothetical protein
MINNHRENNKPINILFFIILSIIILTPTMVKAQTTPLPNFPTNPVTTTNTDITNVIIQENIKTRLEIKQYCDNKITTMIETVKTEGANIIGKNFQEFDRRINEAITKIFIKATIGVFITILLSLLTYYIIKRKIEKKHLPRATIFKEYPLTPTKAGIITNQNNPSTSQSTSNKKTETETLPPLEEPPIPPNKPQELPTFPELQQPILLSPIEKDKMIREQEKINERRKKEAEKQLQKLVDQHNKNRKIHEKLTKKLSKPEEEAKRMQAEHEEIEKKINEISKNYDINVPRA